VSVSGLVGSVTAIPISSEEATDLDLNLVVQSQENSGYGPRPLTLVDTSHRGRTNAVFLRY
jgi:hypothetical protein